MNDYMTKTQELAALHAMNGLSPSTFLKTLLSLGAAFAVIAALGMVLGHCKAVSAGRMDMSELLFEIGWVVTLVIIAGALTAYV